MRNLLLRSILVGPDTSLRLEDCSYRASFQVLEVAGLQVEVVGLQVAVLT